MNTLTTLKFKVFLLDEYNIKVVKGIWTFITAIICIDLRSAAATQHMGNVMIQVILSVLWQ